jgi:L-2-hydroxyglutarate oxidase LhgO
MTDRIECIVIGAGVIGLAVARELALSGREVLVAEAAAAFGTGTSSRNSEVIHAGIYYPAGSLKTRLCVEGRPELYAYCASRNIPHRRCGKLIVATDDAEEAKLADLQRIAAANGLAPDDLPRPMSGADARKLEPALSCTAALLSPSSGIIDSHALMLSYLGEAEANGAALALNTAFVRAEPQGGGFLVTFSSGGETYQLACDLLINCAGLHAQQVAQAIDGVPSTAIPTLYMVKGNYFTVPGRAPFTHLIYPTPVQKGLGVHVTLDLGGQMRFGPDTEDVDRIEYSVDPARGDSFYAAIRRYWPGLPDGALVPAYCGIRPKLQGPGESFRDFLIESGAPYGLPGLVNLFGIESPGLTSSLAVAKVVKGLLA